MKKVLICAVAIIFCAFTKATTSPFKGVVTDKTTGEVLPFVNVFNKMNQKGVSTDISGTFLIEAQEKDSLLITFLGYKTQLILATDKMEIELNQAFIELDQMIVSANKENESKSTTPAAVSTISAEQINDIKPTSIDEVLNQTPGVYMVDLGNEQHTMSIRRPIDYGASYLYLEDGIPIRASGVFNHNALLEINMASINNIEIIRGPISNMYGSEAIGGAVNFITRKPSLKPSSELSFQGNQIGYKRADFTASSTISKKFGYRLSGYFANQRDGILPHSDFNKLALSLVTQYYLSKKTELIWNNSLINYYAEMSGSIDSANFYNQIYTSNHTFTNRQVNAYRSKLALNHHWNKNSKSTITAYYRNNSIRQNPSYRVKDDFKPWTGIGDPSLAHGEINDNSFNSFGLVAQHKQNFNFLNGNFIIGGSTDNSPNTYQANYIRIFKNENGLYDSFSKTDSMLADYTTHLLNIAAYTQLKLEPLKDLNIIASFRFDRFKYIFDNHLDANAYTSILDGENVFSQITPKMGATYQFSKIIGMYINYSQGFVPPQVGELYRGNDIPTLKPVYYDSYEIGGWASFCKGNGKIEMSIYRMDGLNEIISVLQDDGSRIRINSGQTTHQGIEYSLKFIAHKTLTFQFAGTNALHQFIDYGEYSGNTMPQAPSMITNTIVTYKPTYIKGLRASIEWRHVNRYFMDQQNSKEYNGYNLFNMRIGYQYKSVEFWTNLINLTNEVYATVARSSAWGDSYSLGRPRNLNLGLKYQIGKKKKQ